MEERCRMWLAWPLPSLPINNWLCISSFSNDDLCSTRTSWVEKIVIGCTKFKKLFQFELSRVKVNTFICFLHSSYKQALSPFSLVHSNIRWPFCTATPSSFKYFFTFIDDYFICTSFCWWKYRSKLISILTNFVMKLNLVYSCKRSYIN